MSESIKVPVEPEFVDLLVGWHTRKVDTLKHLLTVPEGIEVMVGDDPTGFKLEGETLKGYKLGLEMALMEMGKLPFTYEFESDEPAESEG